MPLTKVSHKFQVVIPKEIREILGISKGDILQVYEKENEMDCTPKSGQVVKQHS